MKRFVAAVALTGVISITTVAGNVPTGDFVAPPPPATTSSTPSTQIDTIIINLLLTITTMIGR